MRAHMHARIEGAAGPLKTDVDSGTHFADREGGTENFPAGNTRVELALFETSI